MGAATRFLLVVASPFSIILHRSSTSLYRRLTTRLPLRPFSTSSTLSPHIRLRNFTLSLPIIDSSQRRLHTQSNSIAAAADDHFYSNNHHPWPEWFNFLQTLPSTPELHHSIAPDDSFVSYDFLSQDFLRSATSCLVFARNRPDILGVLPRRDMVALVENGTPFLFKSSLDTSRRMRAFLGIAGPNGLESDNAQTVDLMKYILSYVSNPSVPSENANYTLELIESSVRNLLSEFSKVIPVSHQHEVPSYSGHAPKPFGQNIEMKKGDWICPRCSFMNFARNVKCLECDEARPQRQLTGREWECPQCTFFNYGRNTACLRCDCKRPGEVSSGTVSSSSGLGYNRGDSANNHDISNRLAANEEKAQRWFNKVSQSNTSADLTNAAADEDFPEIMPLRKGENRFVVSTRKSPLERRLANTQYQRNLGSEVSPKANDSQNGDANINLDTSLGRRLDQIITRTSTSSETDDGSITGQNTGIMRSNTPRSGFLQDGPSKGSNSGYVPFVPLPADKFAKKTESLNSEKVGAASSTSVPSESHDQRATAFVRNESIKVERSQLSENPENEVQIPNKEKEQTTKSDGWFNRVAELHNDPDSTNGISEDDFPEIMPMRKGENKFVVSKKKDRSLTSPMYKRQMAMEQANKNTFVPFVPFPPDYFAKKNTPQPDSTTPAVNSSDEASGSSSKSDDAGQGYTNLNQQASASNQQSALNAGGQSSGYQSQSTPGTHATRNERWNTATEDQQIGSAIYSRAQTSGYKSQISPGTPAIRNETWNSAYSEDQQTESAVYSQAQTSGYQSQSSLGSHGLRNERWGPGPYREDQQTGSAVYSGAQTSSHQSRTSPGNANVSHTGEPNAGSATQNFSSSQYSGNSAGSTNPTPDSQNFKSEWTGKSLEGSAVKEIDPLDMSEEAKTERWFRRVAHIKDINELSQIPDEDFPSIMPMRKGVNRFVVSKRKTPLERRLTSPQYRRNLPLVSSDPFKKDPLKKEDDSN